MNWQLERLKLLKAKYGDPTTLDEMLTFLRTAIEAKGTCKDRPFVVGLGWSVSYRGRIRNTHAAPHNGVTNWRSKDDLPRGYPGYSGRIWLRLGYDNERSWSAELLEHCQTFPGTGGSGSYTGPWTAISSARFERYGHKKEKDAYPEIRCYSWDFRFFHDDFPLIRDTWLKTNLFNVIVTNDSTISIESDTIWEDPATAEADAKFIKSWNTRKAKEKEWFSLNGSGQEFYI